MRKDVFRRVAAAAAEHMGSPWAFSGALLVVLLWGASGPLFHFSDTWQLIINTLTTLVTFLMVFLIQSSQNRDSRAVHLKLDELIRSSTARDSFASLEDATDEELAVLRAEFARMRAARKVAPGSD